MTLGALWLIFLSVCLFVFTQGQNQSSQERMIKTNLNLL